MRLVVENSDQDVARIEARKDLDWPLRELAANLLRVVRGAGYPARLASQMGDVLAAMKAYHATAGCYPSADEIANVLSLTRREEVVSDEMTYAVDTMISGALQMAASELVGQRTQESRGRSELFVGLTEAETIRAANRKSVPGGRRSSQAAFQRRVREKLQDRESLDLE